MAFWEVVGGAQKGGVLVRVHKDGLAGWAGERGAWKGAVPNDQRGSPSLEAFGTQGRAYCDAFLGGPHCFMHHRKSGGTYFHSPSSVGYQG